MRGNNDLLNITQPAAIREIHHKYFKAGADIVETNTFSSTRIAQADYGMEEVAYELNLAGARLAREAAVLAEKEDGKRRFVAGALGPTNRTASISPDVSNPGFRATSFDELVAAYDEQVRGLLDGGAELLMIETIFDTLNAKAAIFAIEKIFDNLKIRLPVMISGTITDLSGRTLSGRDTVRVLEFCRARKAIVYWSQLCARGQGNARPHRRDWHGSPIHSYALIRMRACRTNSAATTKPRNSWRLARRIRERRTRQYHRRMLRHHARAYRGDREGS